MRKREGMWDQEPIEIEVRASDSCVYSFRLSKTEMGQLEEAAEREGIRLAEYVRRAVRLYVGGGMPLAPAVNWCVSTPYADVAQMTTWTDTQCRANVDLRVVYQ